MNPPATLPENSYSLAARQGGVRLPLHANELRGGLFLRIQRIDDLKLIVARLDRTETTLRKVA